MRCCRSSPCGAIEEQFDARVAQRELVQYSKRGAGPTTKLLRDGVAAAGGPFETLIDVGAGIGALTFELLKHGVRRAVSIDASTACVTAGREEAVRRNLAEQVQWVHGDYVALADQLAPADVVTLDRVVCCYPGFEPLLAAAARHARRCLAISYPRDVSFVRVAMAAENALRRLKGKTFRTVLHPPHEMERLILSEQFALSARRTTWFWCVDVYLRPRPSESS
jgi:2-polyprenyl-3-methyl-5-hydroxy-6-metoxy-1,4-benzoquinol methylase